MIVSMYVEINNLNLCVLNRNFWVSNHQKKFSYIPRIVLYKHWWLKAIKFKFYNFHDGSCFPLCHPEMNYLLFWIFISLITPPIGILLLTTCLLISCLLTVRLFPSIDSHSNLVIPYHLVELQKIQQIIHTHLIGK